MVEARSFGRTRTSSDRIAISFCRIFFNVVHSRISTTTSAAPQTFHCRFCIRMAAWGSLAVSQRSRKATVVCWKARSTTISYFM